MLIGMSTWQTLEPQTTETRWWKKKIIMDKTSRMEMVSTWEPAHDTEYSPCTFQTQPGAVAVTPSMATVRGAESLLNSQNVMDSDSNQPSLPPHSLLGPTPPPFWDRI